MKIVIETGSEDHSTSSASVQARFVGGAYDGQYLYQQHQFQVKAEWDKRNDKHSRWVATEYNLPDGMEVAVRGKGATGARGTAKHDFHRVYRVDSAAEVLEQEVYVGLRTCVLKGRLVLVRDLLAEKAKAAEITEEGF